MAGEDRLRFGQYRGLTFAEALRRDPVYGEWALQLTSPRHWQLIFFREYCRSQLPAFCRPQLPARRPNRSRSPPPRQNVGSVRSPADIARNRNDFEQFLSELFNEHKASLPTLSTVDLKTGYDPFRIKIERDGTAWMSNIRHHVYRSLPRGHWNPKNILEWGQTYYDVYLDSATEEEVSKQKAVLKLMCGWCCFQVTPDVERLIYWELADHMTHCKNIKQTFCYIFKRFDQGCQAPDEPPNKASLSRPPEEFFGEGFAWNMSWPVAAHVSIACKYYMWRVRTSGSESAESRQSLARRMLIIHMLRKLEASGDLHAKSNKDGSDKLYSVPGSTASILVRVPDESAVHVFAQPEDGGSEEFSARVFALFRHFSGAIAKKIDREDGAGNPLGKHFPRIGDDPDNLPDLEVMREELKGTRCHCHLQVLEDFPEMLADLTVPENRPSLNAYVGWKRKHTHQHTKLARAIFAVALGMKKRKVKKFEKATIKQMVKAWRHRGVSTSFHEVAKDCASWKHTRKRDRKARQA